MKQPTNYTVNTQTFTLAKNAFDNIYGNLDVEYQGFLVEHLNVTPKSNFKKDDGTKNEQYYKWQFLYALVHSGLVAKDYIGTEIYFPKGNKSSAALKIDAAIFDNKD